MFDILITKARKDVPIGGFLYPAPEILGRKVIGRIIDMGSRHYWRQRTGYPAPPHRVLAKVAAYPAVGAQCMK